MAISNAYGAETFEGAFATTCGAFSRISILHTIADGTDPNDDSIKQLDPANLVDADAFEYLTCGSPNLSACDQLTDNEVPMDPIPQPNQTEVDSEDQADVVDTESASAVVIESFPFGRPGAPIPDRAQGPSAHDSGWAPFHSQLDWEVACWAKRRGQTSTAVTELLAIPGVSASNLLY